MILPDHEIGHRIKTGNLVIEPIDDLYLQLQPASLDIRLGSDFKAYRSSGGMVFDVCNGDMPEYETIRENEDSVVIPPGGFVLATTKERVEIPDDLLAKVEGRSSIGRLGIMIHVTAGIIDPGYKGEITLEISNVGDTTVRLQEGMRIAQLVFSTLSSPCNAPYGDDRNSKYQNQKGAQPSRLDRDREITN